MKCQRLTREKTASKFWPILLLALMGSLEWIGWMALIPSELQASDGQSIRNSNSSRAFESLSYTIGRNPSVYNFDFQYSLFATGVNWMNLMEVVNQQTPQAFGNSFFMGVSGKKNRYSLSMGGSFLYAGEKDVKFYAAGLSLGYKYIIWNYKRFFFNLSTMLAYHPLAKLEVLHQNFSTALYSLYLAPEIKIDFTKSLGATLSAGYQIQKSKRMNARIQMAETNSIYLDSISFAGPFFAFGTAYYF
jgi:hypothetical protein